jgi:hypothetical protein
MSKLGPDHLKRLNSRPLYFCNVELCLRLVVSPALRGVGKKPPEPGFQLLFSTRTASILRLSKQRIRISHFNQVELLTITVIRQTAAVRFDLFFKVHLVASYRHSQNRHIYTWGDGLIWKRPYEI